MGHITNKEKLQKTLFKFGAQLLLSIVLLFSSIQRLERIRWSNNLIIENDLNVPLKSTSSEITILIILGVTILIWIYVMIREYRGYEKV